MTTVFIQGNSLILRTVTANDKEAILWVYLRCEDFLALGSEPKASLEMVMKDMETSQHEGGCFCGIYHTDGHLLGVVDFIPLGFEGKPDIAFLSLIMIATPFRKQGIGTETIQFIEREIKNDARVTKICSAVQENNPKAIKFWQKNGYRIVGKPELRPDNTTVFQLCKNLS
ncbi:MAG TPA: GNAT family N-acetyltransferase [Dehalococcoidales bacterium]